MKFPITNTKTEQLEIYSEQIASESFYIHFYVEDEELAKKIIENIMRNCTLGTCKNCGKRFIVNSTTHMICWRCRNKDKAEGSGNVEI